MLVIRTLPASIVLLLGACAEVVPSDACVDYVNCIRAQDALAGTETDLDRFEEGGACWGNPEGAALCDRACTNGLDWMSDSYEGLPEECDE